MPDDRVILVDAQNRELGTAGKEEVHVSGALHRALSVFLFDQKGRQLIQRRADRKYHTGGLWSNACCSHPRPNESIHAAVLRRVQEELGLDCEVRHFFDMKYCSELHNGLVEHEYDHVFVGTFSGTPDPDPAEVAETRLVDAETLQGEIASNPSAYTPWFRLLVPEVDRSLREPGADRWPQAVVEAHGTIATFYFPEVQPTSF